MEIIAEYNERCRADSHLANAMKRVPLRPAFGASWRQRLLTRPLFARARDMTAAADDVLRVFDLLASLPQRLFDGDMRRYCEALGFDSNQAGLIGRFAAVAPARYGRADMYHDGTGFKLLEFNVASDIGGTQHGQLARALFNWSPFRELARDHGLGYVDTCAHVANALRVAAEPVGGGTPPSVLVLTEPGGIKKDSLVLAGLVEMLNAYGIDAHLAEPDAIRYRSRRVVVGDADIHVVLRYFNLDDIAMDPSSAEWAEPLLRAHEDGRVVIWTGLDSAAYSHKTTLAFLSDPRWRAAFSPGEIAAADRLLPVTRILRDCRSVMDGQEVDLLEYARAERLNLILKPVRGWGGHGITPGWECQDRDWRVLLRDCADGDHLIQRRVVPRPEPVVNPAERLVENWIAAYGMFVTPAGYAGAHGRAVPAHTGSVVNYSLNDQARTTTVFTYGQ
ncbi:MAG TPA: hypothetical protein VGI74_26760 [Streptosporangiaceae bacterium]